MMDLGYRIHRADEDVDTVLDTDRPDGWVASDESYETQPRGVSACSSLALLAKYVRHYGMQINEGDQLLEMSGTIAFEDRDEYACRMVVDEVDSMGSALDWHRAILLDLEEIRETIDDEGPAAWATLTAHHGPGVVRWLKDRIEDNY